MNTINENFENSLGEALGLYEDGMLIQKILEAFPQYRQELKEIFEEITVLKKQKDSILPSKELLAEIISRIPWEQSSVTKKESDRYSYRGMDKGRTSFTIIDQIHNAMTINWKIVAPIGIVAIIAVIFLSSQFGERMAPSTEKQPAPVMTKESPVMTKEGVDVVVLPPATGNVDAAVDGILAGITNDDTILNEDADDASLIDIDSQAISDFDQAYDETEF